MASSHQPLSPPVISSALQHSFANFRALVHDLHFLDDDPVEWIALRDSLKALTITRWHDLEIKDNKSARDDSEQCAFYGLGIEKELKDLKEELEQFHRSKNAVHEWAEKVDMTVSAIRTLCEEGLEGTKHWERIWKDQCKAHGISEERSPGAAPQRNRYYPINRNALLRL